MNNIAIIGTGRVGLPLALFFGDIGWNVFGIDKDKNIRNQVNRKVMPFEENGCQELLNRSNLKIHKKYNIIKDADVIIITVGTPLLQHVETDLQYIKEVFNSIKSHIKKGHTIILRSTVAPHTSEFIKKYLEKETPWIVGEDIFLSFCPERLAEGKALKELQTLPQIIGADDDLSFEKARKVFETSGIEIIRTTTIEAELTKLFCNISRYMQFSVVNYLAIIAENYNCDIHNILNIINKDYPRPIYGTVGLCAGTCLRKDWGMINESIPYADMLMSAYKMNEFMPKFLIEEVKHYIGDYTNKKIGILGYTFKKDSDDVRDSLVPKFIRYLEREVPDKIYVNDFHVKNIDDGISKLKVEFMEDIDVLFILINHSEYENNFGSYCELLKDDCLIVDLWNVSGRNKLIYRKE